MIKMSEQLKEYYDSLNSEELKEDLRSFVDDCYVVNDNLEVNQLDDYLSVYIEAFNISLIKHSEKSSESMIIYNRLFEYHRKVEMDRENTVYTILQKKYDRLGELESIVEQTYSFSPEQLKAFYSPKVEDYNLLQILDYFRRSEASKDLKNFSTYTEFTTSRITGNTYINGEKVNYSTRTMTK